MPFAPEWSECLERNFTYDAHLCESERAKLRDFVKIFVAEKNWVGCGGLEITDEVRVTIAATAGLLVLGIEPPYYFEGVKSVLVYPSAYRHPPQGQGTGQVVYEDMPVQGEAWHRGPIVLSWEDVLGGARNPSDGHNVVLHEFAHHLDGLDGDTDGVPPMQTRGQYDQWFRVTRREYEQLVRHSQAGKATLLDHYGASDEAEFFAVATEAFFERPVQLKRRQGELYEVLHKFYRQDPARWHEAGGSNGQPTPGKQRRR